METKEKKVDNVRGITPEQFSLWQEELIEQAREDKKRVGRFLIASLAGNVILAAAVLVLLLK